MKTNILCVGKIKEKYWADAITDYSRRIGAYCGLETIEVAEGKQESERLLKALKSFGDRGYTIALDGKGKRLSSEGFSFFYSDIINRGYGDIVFVIGGSDGLSDEVKRACDHMLSFSDMTFPRQMIRVFLLEQIYRAWKIIRNEPYHK